MVNSLHTDFQYITAGDGDLDKLLQGKKITGLVHADLRASESLLPGETGVLVALGKTPEEPLRPLALVCDDHDVRRLCGRYAHVRTDFSPLTAWCHLLSSAFYKDLDGVMREPQFRGPAAAWCGLVVAETLLLTGRPLASIRISACLASATYAVARTKALWESPTIESIQERFDSANKLCRGKGAAARYQDRVSQVRSSFVPMWRCLTSLNGRLENSNRNELHPLVMALKALHDARTCRSTNEAEHLARPLMKTVPEAGVFGQLTEMAPEARLKLFDELVMKFTETDPKSLVRRNGLALATGYLATVAAGGAATLSLLDNWAGHFPELTGWAYLVGGIGEGVTWTSGFDGLGRLIARELHRPLRLDEPPTCDFAFDEAIVLADSDLKDPLVHLRIKQAKVLSVSIFPGVNISIPIVDAAAAEVTYGGTGEQSHVVEIREPTSREDNVLRTVAEALWPHLLPLVIDETTQRFAAKRRGKAGSQGNRRKGKSDAAAQLPLADRKR